MLAWCVYIFTEPILKLTDLLGRAFYPIRRIPILFLPPITKVSSGWEVRDERHSGLSNVPSDGGNGADERSVLSHDRGAGSGESLIVHSAPVASLLPECGNHLFYNLAYKIRQVKPGNSDARFPRRTPSFPKVALYYSPGSVILLSYSHLTKVTFRSDT